MAPAIIGARPGKRVELKKQSHPFHKADDLFVSNSSLGGKQQQTRQVDPKSLHLRLSSYKPSTQASTDLKGTTNNNSKDVHRSLDH